MKIPYAYLIIGDQVYFQSQNQGQGAGTSKIDMNNGRQRVIASSSPAAGGSMLYVNGGRPANWYNVVKFERSSLLGFIKLIKEHNARLNNV